MNTVAPQPRASITHETTNLSPRAAAIFTCVRDAMQPAEEIGGPDDYLELMQAIIDEAKERLGAYQCSAQRTGSAEQNRQATRHVSTQCGHRCGARRA